MITNVVLLYYLDQSLSMALLSFLFPILGEEKKLTEIFIFTSFWCLKMFYEGLKGLHKTFCGTKKIFNENLS